MCCLVNGYWNDVEIKDGVIGYVYFFKIVFYVISYCINYIFIYLNE